MLINRKDGVGFHGGLAAAHFAYIYIPNNFILASISPSSSRRTLSRRAVSGASSTINTPAPAVT